MPSANVCRRHGRSEGPHAVSSAAYARRTADLALKVIPTRRSSRAPSAPRRRIRGPTPGAAAPVPVRGRSRCAALLLLHRSRELLRLLVVEPALLGAAGGDGAQLRVEARRPGREGAWRGGAGAAQRLRVRLRIGSFRVLPPGVLQVDAKEGTCGIARGYFSGSTKMGLDHAISPSTCTSRTQ